MAIESLQANQGIYKALSKLTGKDYYKTKTGVIIKTDKGKGSVSYDTKTGEITCEGLENALITGTAKADKINIVDCKNIKATGGLGNDEFTIKYSDTVQINGGLGKDQVILYDNPKNVKLKSIENEIPVTTPPAPEPTIPEPEPTVPKEPERDGVIDGFKQGDITDSQFFSQLIAMSQTEEGAKIIEDSIVWDNKNRQATVHCKGLGVDVTISYDELKDAKDNGITTFYSTPEGVDYEEKSSYSSGDDDVFLLEYVMRKLNSASAANAIFKCADSSGIINPYTFLAGVKYDNNYLTDTNQIEEVLNNLASDNGEKLVSSVKPKSTEEIKVTDANGKTVTLDPNQTYAIKEVKNGLVTIVNPKDSTNDSEYTQTFTYAEFSKYFNITKPTDISKVSNISLEIQILEDYVLLELSNLGISFTTAKIVKSERNGEIEWSEQGGIGDCSVLSSINALSYSEAGRKIIKESIVWDDENRQAIVHCKGLGIDITVSYDELKEAEEKGNKYFSPNEYGGGAYSRGDDDMFLLEYVVAKLVYLEGIALQPIEASSNIVRFLVNVDAVQIHKTEIKDYLKKLEDDGGKNLFATTAPKEGLTVTDVNGKTARLVTPHAYAIKEVKNGLVTVVNPWNSSDEAATTQTFTYDDFCKYFDDIVLHNLSKHLDKTPTLMIKEGVNLADYGITIMTENVKFSKRNGEIEWTSHASFCDEQMSKLIDQMASTEIGAQIIKESIFWDDENKEAIVHCKGLGIDITVSYDELQSIRDNNDWIFSIDDDIFLLEYAIKKLSDIKNEDLINFRCVNNDSPEHPATFLANAREEMFYNSADKSELIELFKRIESDNKQKLGFEIIVKFDEESHITENNSAYITSCEIKEIKDGFITIADPSGSGDDLTFSYEDFCQYLYSARLIDLSKPSEETPEIIIDNSVNLSDYGITVTTGILRNSETEPTPEPTIPKEPERDGVIDSFKQGDVGDSKFFAQLIAMSQTEAGAQIIKDSITWDDENKQAIVHCKGLGVDVIVYYQDLQDAKENGNVWYKNNESGEIEISKQFFYSSGDDDILLLEYAMNRLNNFIVSPINSNMFFKCTDSQGVLNPYTFLAGIKYDTNYLTDEVQIKEVLNALESDNKEKLVSNAKPKSTDEIEVTDTNGKTVALDPNQTYAIKEVKNGLVTIVNPKDSTYNSQYTQTFTYSEFAKYFNITNPTDITKSSDITPEIHVLENSGLSQLLDLGVTPTTAKVVIEGERNGEIEWSMQGGIGDCWFLSEINAMSYSEEGRRIIKESIVWDDENRQAIVHCKGLGIDMVVSYDELAEAEKNGNKYYHDEGLDDIGGHYSYGDDDVFLLEYVMAKLDYLEDNKLIDFEAIGSYPDLYTFLAGAETQSQIYDEAAIKEFLDKLEADGGKNLAATASTSAKISEEDAGMFGFSVTDANGKKANLTPNHAYAIKEVKNGLVTVVNPWNSSDEAATTQTFTYDEFCKYFTIHQAADLSKTTDETPKMHFREGINPSDYGINITSGEEHILKRDGIIERTDNDSYVISEISNATSCDKGAQIIKEAIVWDDENGQAIVHCKGLGIDITISYDELKNARENSEQLLGCRKDLLPMDDDTFLLQYVSKKIEDIKNNGLITFDCINNVSPESFATFLAGVKVEYIDHINESEIREFLDKLEADGGKNLIASFYASVDEHMNITEEDSLIWCNYRIKEVKDGYVTIGYSLSSTNDQTFTYDDFCKYFKSAELTDYSKPSEETPEITISDGVNLSDYGITVTTGILRNNETEPTPEPTEPHFIIFDDFILNDDEPESVSDPEDEPISEPIDITITNLIPNPTPAPPFGPEVIFISEPKPEPTDAEHTILDAGLDMKKSERKGTLTFEQQTPEPEPAEAPQKTTFKTISGSFLKTTGKISKK